MSEKERVNPNTLKIMATGVMLCMNLEMLVEREPSHGGDKSGWKIGFEYGKTMAIQYTLNVTSNTNKVF